MSTYRVIDSTWNGDGFHTVTVLAPWPRTRAVDAGVRRAARSADPMRKAVTSRILRWDYRPDLFGGVATVKIGRR